MRRCFLVSLGVLEVSIAVAVVLVALGLPSRADVATNFRHVEKVTDGSETQVRLMREQMAELRRQDFASKAEQFRVHTRIAADATSRQRIDFDTVSAISQSLADVSKGLNTWANTVDADRLKQVSAGLGQAGSFLETGVVDPSEKSAAELDRTLAGLEKDANRLAKLLRQAPPDLSAAKTVYDGLAAFDTGLDKLGQMVKTDQIAAMKEGLTGLDTSLSSTADQVEKVGAISYPIVSFNGLRPSIQTKPFWPEGEKVAAGLRKATKGVKAANKQLEVMAKDLPELQKSIAESRKSVTLTRKTLGAALKNRAETEKLLKSVPDQTAALAAALPNIGRTLTHALRETSKLRELATGLKSVQKTLDDTLKNWPEVARGLKKSADVLHQAKLQLDEATANRAEYERAMASSSEIARSLADILPALTDQLDSRLGQQEASLDQMESGLGELNKSLPVLEDKTNRVLQMMKWLLYLVAILIALHAAYVLSDAVRARQRATPRTGPPIT